MPSLLHPEEADGSCRIVRIPDGSALTVFPVPCERTWSVTADPKDPSDAIVTLGDHPPRRGDAALPALPGEVDAVGFDADGGIVALSRVGVDATLDEAAQKAWIEVDGARHDLDYDMASMYGVVICEVLRLEDGAWKREGERQPRQLFEGMSTPWCDAVGPTLAPTTYPGNDRMDVQVDETFEAPDDLKPLGEPEAAWAGLPGLEAAVAGLYFEGFRLNTPIAVRTDGAWRALPGTEKAGEPLNVVRRGDLLLACTPERAWVFDAADGFREIWSGPTPCPAFWP
ncbi:MAG: hypothetical protein H6736_14880 [Alphaproteobacteria bacterium]|nr:hypothetical protein [Alphaproteobacteria bacterium]